MKTSKNFAPSVLPIPILESDEPLQSGLTFFMDNETEIWKDIPGYEGIYQASSFGRIKSTYRQKRILKPQKAKKYFHLRLSKDKKISIHLLHRLIAKTFKENSENKKTVNHIDGNPLNNFACNLEWATQQENILHKINILKKGSRSNHPRALLTELNVSEIRSSDLSNKELANKFLVSIDCIAKVRHNVNWKI
jgi:hypothetical protein